jgi:hypothetical protein
MSLRFVVGCCFGAVARLSAQVYADADAFKPTSTPRFRARSRAWVSRLRRDFVVVSRRCSTPSTNSDTARRTTGMSPRRYGSNQIEIA